MGNILSCIRGTQKYSNKYFETVERYSDIDKEQLLCEECLVTHRPYTYSETLKRALVSGVNEWEDVDDHDHIARRYSEYLKGVSDIKYRDRHKTLTKLFGGAADFSICQGQFNKERRRKISAGFLCFDCEKYLCAKCLTRHCEYFTFSESDKNNIDNWGGIETKIMQEFVKEGDAKGEYIKQERAMLCNVVDVKGSIRESKWNKLILREVDDVRTTLTELDNDPLYFGYKNICILNDDQTLLILDSNNTNTIQVFNINSADMIRSIKLGSAPWRIIEIPSTDPSQCLIAVSLNHKKQIQIMNIHSEPVQINSIFNVQGECYELAYCNNKIIILCADYPDRQLHHAIHVMDISGKITNIIDLHNLPGIKLKWFNIVCLSVHSESETIYICHFTNPSCVISLSLDGKVLHSVSLTDLKPVQFCVDKEQTVYFMGGMGLYTGYLPLYKLSREGKIIKIVDKDAANISMVTSMVYHKDKIYMVTYEGLVYIFNLV